MSEEINYLEMSDEEILNAPEPSFEPTVPTDPNGEVEDQDTSDNSEDDQSETDSGTTEAEENSESVDTDETGESNSSNDPIDFEAAYKKLTAPFKANGREMKVESVDDAVQLMQMGANYNKKMAALKPGLRILKMLENNDLMDESKLSFLIDLQKNDPKAISKLVHDSGISTYELNEDTAKEYQQTSHAVPETALVLEEVIERIKDTPAFARTSQVVSSQWDAASREIIGANPQVLELINTHIEQGVFDRITQEIESQKMMNRLPSGMSDMAAYKYVGDQLVAAGAFNHLEAQQGKSPALNNTVRTDTRVANNAKLNERRKAASPTRTNPNKSSPLPADFNPLGMSDEDFEKNILPKFI